MRNDLIFNNVGRNIWNHKNTASISIAYSNIGEIFGRYTNEGGNISINPIFADSTGGDFRLTGGSPCIDAGTSDGAPATDFEDDSRPQGKGYDIGADEYVEMVPGGIVAGRLDLPGRDDDSGVIITIADTGISTVKKGPA